MSDASAFFVDDDEQQPPLQQQPSANGSSRQVPPRRVSVLTADAVIHRTRVEAKLCNLVSTERGIREQLEREEARKRAHIQKLDHANRHITSVHKIAARHKTVADQEERQRKERDDAAAQSESSFSMNQTSTSGTTTALIQKSKSQGGGAASLSVTSTTLAAFAEQSTIAFEEEQAAAAVDQSLKQYMAYLRDAPDRTDVEKLRLEREHIAVAALGIDEKNDHLRQEHHARLEYTSLVLSDVEAQRRESCEVLHTKLATAMAQQTRDVAQRACAKLDAFEKDRASRLDAQRSLRSYVTQHGNYPRHILEAKHQRHRAEAAQQALAFLRRGFVKGPTSPSATVALSQSQVLSGSGGGGGGRSPSQDGGAADGTTTTTATGDDGPDATRDGVNHSNTSPLRMHDDAASSSPQHHPHPHPNPSLGHSTGGASHASVGSSRRRELNERRMAEREAFLSGKLEDAQAARVAHRHMTPGQRRASTHCAGYGSAQAGIAAANAVRLRCQQDDDGRRAAKAAADAAFLEQRQAVLDEKHAIWKATQQQARAYQHITFADMQHRATDTAAARQAELSAEMALWQEDIATLRQGFEASRLVERVLTNMVQTRSVTEFLNRMHMNDEFADDMEVLRKKRTTENRQYWLDKREATHERRVAAAAMSQSMRQQHALELRNESLMAREAVIVQRAKDQLQRQELVEEHHVQRIERLTGNPNDYLARKQVIQVMYSGRMAQQHHHHPSSASHDEAQRDDGDGTEDNRVEDRSTPAAHPTTNGKPRAEGTSDEDDGDEPEFEIQCDDASDDDEQGNAQHQQPNGGEQHNSSSDPLMTRAHFNAHQEHLERLRKRKRLPQPIPVLPPSMQRPQPSLLYPTAKNIAACGNPDIQSTAAKLLLLETDRMRELREKELRAIAHRNHTPSAASSVNSSKAAASFNGAASATTNPAMLQEATAHLSDAQRAEAFERLTHRSVADEARAHSKIEDSKPKTFHDHLAPVVGCNTRLYSADPKTRYRDPPPPLAASQQHAKKHVSSRPPAFWGAHFSDEAVRRHQLAMDGLAQAAIVSSPVGVVPKTSDEEIAQIVKRLATPVRRRAHSATPTNGGASGGLRKQRVPSADVLRTHVERFYIKGREKERESAAALDARYQIVQA